MPPPGRPSRSPPVGPLRFIPALAVLRDYDRRTFIADAMAGLTVATVAVPQAMAYALVIGLPPQYGLYTAIVMTAIGALFDSSRQLINGPTNALSIALFAALATLPEEARLPAAIALAFMVGALQLGITAFRLGDLSRYVSHSVVVGFTVGASALLVLDQLRHLLGLPRTPTLDEAHFLVRSADVIARVGDANLLAVALSAGTIAVVLGLRRVNGWLQPRRGVRLPEFLLAVVGSAVIVGVFDLREQVPVIGAVPSHLPGFALPPLRWELVRDYGTSALALAVLGLLEAVAMAKNIAARSGQPLDVNQQCLSEGLANLGGSFFQCFPGSGSLTRSALNQEAGARTQWSGVFSAVGVAVTVVAFAPWAAYVPRAALAAILIVTAARMVDVPTLLRHVRATRSDAAIVAVTAISAFAISIEFCILVGVLGSFLLYVPKAAHMNMVELTVTPQRLIRHRVADDRECPRLRLWSLEGEMFFGAAPDLEAHLATIEAGVTAETRVVVLRTRDLRNPDAVGLELLAEFVARMQARGVILIVCGIRPDLQRVLQRSGLDRVIGEDRLFFERPVLWTGTLDAVHRAYQLLGDAVCEHCPRRRESAEQRASRAGWHYQI